MAHHMPEAGGVFIQAESELAAINMCFGTAAAGQRTMTSSSSPGISLKQEGISYCAGAELPVVIVNVMRGGPGLGNIEPSQGDYFQATKGGGHGDYHIIVLAPYSVEEFAELVMLAFDLGDLYRTPVMVLADGQIGQMMEPCSFRAPPHRELPPKDWALTGADGRPQADRPVVLPAGRRAGRTLQASPGEIRADPPARGPLRRARRGGGGRPPRRVRHVGAPVAGGGADGEEARAEAGPHPPDHALAVPRARSSAAGRSAARNSSSSR